MCRGCGGGAEPSKKQPASMRGSLLGPGDSKKYERRYEYARKAGGDPPA